MPVAVSGLSTGIAGVSAGDYHACAWDSAGALKCWGSNSHGQLGDNSATDSDVPVLVNGLSSSVAAAVAGSDDACALTGSGTMKCWGFNTQGQLGDNAITDSHVPVDVQGLTTAVSAIAANGHSCALGVAGDIHCWGWNAAGQLGDGSTTDRHLPVAVSALSSGVVAVSAGGEHTCALMKSGDVRCSGPERRWTASAMERELTAMCPSTSGSHLPRRQQRALRTMRRARSDPRAPPHAALLSRSMALAVRAVGAGTVGAAGREVGALVVRVDLPGAEIEGDEALTLVKASPGPRSRAPRGRSS